MLRHTLTHMIKTSPHPTFDTFPFCDVIFICCLAGATSCPSETNQATSQAGVLNRKGDNTASNPASYVTLNPPSKKQLASKRKTQPVLLNPWWPAPKDVTISIKPQSQGSFPTQ